MWAPSYHKLESLLWRMSWRGKKDKKSDSNPTGCLSSDKKPISISKPQECEGSPASFKSRSDLVNHFCQGEFSGFLELVGL